MKRIHQKCSKKDINFLIKNYAILGSKKCAELLGHTSWMYISKKASLLGLKRNNLSFRESQSLKQVDMNPFHKIRSPKLAYVLGFIWADGYISKTKNRIAVAIHQKDFNYLKSIFLQYIPFHIHISIRNSQPCFYLNDLQLHSFLKDNDFIEKSLVTPSKILSKIPKRLHRYFFLGFFDGDGCFTNIKTCPTINFVGNYNQNWDDIVNIIEHVTAHTPKILRRNDDKRGHKSSVIYFYGKDRIKKFLDYLYKKHNIGLSRKRERYLQFTNRSI